MIFSSIHTKDDFKNYPAAVQRAIEYLKSNDFTKMETGVYEIEGKLMYAQVFDAETEPLEARKPEYHEKYLDVQFLVTGREKLGFTPDTGNYEVAERYDDHINTWLFLCILPYRYSQTTGCRWRAYEGKKSCS